MLDAWPADWRALLARWLRGGTSSVRGSSLFKAAGNQRHLAIDVLEALLESGWIEVEDQFGRGTWSVHRLTWLDADGLRETMGLPRRDVSDVARSEALANAPRDPRLLALHESLAGKSAQAVVARAQLIHKLDDWLASGRMGARQQFAQFARGDTKALSASEWEWIDLHAPLNSLGISRHTPALFIRAPLTLAFADGRLDLAVVPDVIGLSPETIAALNVVEGSAARWLLVENRTSFEEVARRTGSRDAVVWLPGFAPDWWLDAMAVLVRLHPAPVHIAADPDPAGIDIALRAGALWPDTWKPWAMSATALDSIQDRKPLNDYDRQRLALLTDIPLPEALRELAMLMSRDGIKGEQEALDLLAWL